MDKIPSRITEQAAGYLARRVSGAGMARDDDLQAWLRADPRHAHAYVEACRAWEQASRLSEDAELQALKAAHLAALRRHHAWWRRPPALGIAAALLVLLGVGYLFRDLLGPAPVAMAYATDVGEQRSETLQDGTRIVLNTGTALQAVYAPRRREVQLLNGEAQFEVAPDAARPFVVHASGGTITALGTRFQVRQDGAVVVVTLLEGSVEVAFDRRRQVLRPNQQATLSPAGSLTVAAIDPEMVSGWLDGWLRFRATPLEEVIAEANRYSVRKLRLGSQELAQVRMNGTFRAGESEAIAAAAGMILPVRVDDSGEDIVLLPH